MSSGVFDNCDLSMAVFENTNLEKADFTTSYNYDIDPEKNRMKKAKFLQNGLHGLLLKYDLVVRN